MIARVVTYHALQGKNVEKWMETTASELRGVKGMRRVEFIRNQSDPSQHGAIMLFNSQADLDRYKEEQARPTRLWLKASARPGWTVRNRSLNSFTKYSIFDRSRP
jgi:hypothetical protein